METVVKSTTNTTVKEVVASPVRVSGVSCRKNSKGEVYYQVEFSQMIRTSRPNLLALMNKGDERFSGGIAKERKAWMIASPESIAEYIGIKPEVIEALEEGQNLALNIEDFKVDGHAVNIQIEELTEAEVIKREEATRGSKQNVTYVNFLEKKQKRAKQAPATATQPHMYFTKDGGLIFSFTSLVTGEPKHTLISDAEKVDASILFPNSVSANVADAKLV